MTQPQVCPVYKCSNGTLSQGDSLVWLSEMETGTADLIFADPPYNLNKAEWDNFESQEHYIAWSVRWIEQAGRVLKPLRSS